MCYIQNIYVHVCLTTFSILNSINLFLCIDAFTNNESVLVVLFGNVYLHVHL